MSSAKQASATMGAVQGAEVPATETTEPTTSSQTQTSPDAENDSPEESEHEAPKPTAQPEAQANEAPKGAAKQTEQTQDDEQDPEPKELPAYLAVPKGAVEQVGQSGISFVEHIGNVALMLFETAIVAFKPPYRFKLLFESMEEVGVGALFIVLLTGMFTGLVMSLQQVYAFETFNAETLVGGSTALALVRELGPVLTGLMVSGRSGSAMATTLGTMRVSEQIDAMEVMAVNSLQYLVLPRIVAAILMTPLLVLLFNLVGMIGAYL
ncbi:MAG: ABC transporter permease, partial [Myxococcota bacterium]